MGGISQGVKMPKKSEIFTLYTLGFLDHVHFFCFDINYYLF